MAAINKIKYNFQSRSGISTFAPIRPDFSQELEARSKQGRKIEGSTTATVLAKELEDFRNENFSVGTLGALNYVVSGMRDLPGRKAVMLFSEGFGFSPRIMQAMRILADVANRSSVLIYTIDPRGLQDPLAASAQDDIIGGTSDGFFDERRREFISSQQSLQYLAYETGGFPFINQNSIDLGIRRVVADQSSYYLLGYQPVEDTFDPKKNKFNKLEIKLKRPDLKVRYRSGFFSVTDEKIQNVAQTPRQKLTRALTSPFGASDINLNLYPVYQNDVKNGDVIQALVYINAKDLSFTAVNGKQSATFDLLAMLFGDNGMEINQLSKTYTIEISDRVYQNLLTNGFVYKLDVPIKKSGAYQFRVALRDTNSNKIGAASQFIEVPNFKKRISLSNLILDNFTPVEWEKVKLGDNQSTRSVLLDSTLREFKRGSILRYDYVIYNPKQVPLLTMQMRLIHNGKVIYEEKPAPLRADGQTDLMRLQSFGAFDIGKDLELGTYILQIVVVDPKAKGADSFSSQFVEFEVTE
jgi:VWFA-related protein